jgi:cytochrome P450
MTTSGDLPTYGSMFSPMAGFQNIALGLVRAIWPVPSFGKYSAALRYEDVVAVLQRNEDFPTNYSAKLDVITGNQPFMLGMPAGPDFDQNIAALRRTTPASDIADRLVPATIAAAQQGLDGAHGSLELVNYIRDITFETLCNYFGTPDTPAVDLQSWAQTLFTFLFADPNNDPALRVQVDKAAPALQAYVESLIVKRKASPGGDDLLGRALKLQAEGVPGVTDAMIRTALVGFIVAGLPQPAMAVPKALDQLFLRPRALAAAQAAARDGDDATLAAYFFEALRFNPLAPLLQRRTVTAQKLSGGSVPAGKIVFAVTKSAMMDGRAIPHPYVFNPNRPPTANLAFGTGMHMCFAKAINEATIPLMLKPLLEKPGLRRAPGSAGRLVMKGPFPQSLTVNF